SSVVGLAVLKWNPVAGAARYEVQYQTMGATSPAFTATGTQYSPEEIGSTLIWYVRARDAAGNLSAWSPSRSVTILPPPFDTLPSPASPAGNVIVHTGMPMLTWDKALHNGWWLNSDQYQVQLATDSQFHNILFDQTGAQGALSTQFVAID